MTDLDADEAIVSEIQRKQRRERARLFARSPRGAADLMAEVFRRRGYASQQARIQLQGAWNQVLEETATASLANTVCRLGKLRRGRLEIWVANSMVNQELTFHKRDIVARLRELAPDHPVEDLRIRVGSKKHG